MRFGFEREHGGVQLIRDRLTVSLRVALALQVGEGDRFADHDGDAAEDSGPGHEGAMTLNLGRLQMLRSF